MKSLWFLVFSSCAAFAQSYDLKTEKEALARIDAAVKSGDNTAFVNECNQLLERHAITAFGWYTCGKNLLYVKTSDPKQALRNAHQAYHRLKRATDDFARTGKQVYLTLDGLQYLGLAAMLFNDYDRAMVHFRAVLARDNRLPAAWFNLGVIYELRGLRDESMRAYDRYQRLKTGSDVADF